MAQQALRTIALGYKDMTFAEYKKAIGEYSIEPTPIRVGESPQPHHHHAINETLAASLKDQEDLLFGESGFTSDEEENLRKTSPIGIAADAK